MAQFPKLKTGAVAQYPSSKGHLFSTEVRRFVDGTEQRYRDFRGTRKRWMLSLSQLDETELAEVLQFFFDQQGRLGSFDFEDPWTGAVVTECRFEHDALSIRADGEFNTNTQLLIVGPPAS